MRCLGFRGGGVWHRINMHIQCNWVGPRFGAQVADVHVINMHGAYVETRNLFVLALINILGAMELAVGLIVIIIITILGATVLAVINKLGLIVLAVINIVLWHHANNPRPPALDRAFAAF